MTKRSPTARSYPVRVPRVPVGLLVPMVLASVRMVGQAGLFAGFGGRGRECVVTAELVDAAGGRRGR